MEIVNPIEGTQAVVGWLLLFFTLGIRCQLGWWATVPLVMAFALWWSRSADSLSVERVDKKEGFSVRVVRESGKTCLVRENGVTSKGCYYRDVGGCAIPQEGVRGECPATYEDFRRRYGDPGPDAVARDRPLEEDVSVPAGTPSSRVEGCTEQAWMKVLALREDEIDQIRAGKSHPLSACMSPTDPVLGNIRKRFLQVLRDSPNSRDICHRIRKDESGANNSHARKVFRDIYRECFVDAEPSEPTTSAVLADATGRGASNLQVKSNGFVLVDEPEMIQTQDHNGKETDDILRRHMRQALVEKCHKFVSFKTPEQIQAYVELGEKVEHLDWWKQVNTQIQRTADELRRAKLYAE